MPALLYPYTMFVCLLYSTGKKNCTTLQIICVSLSKPSIVNNCHIYFWKLSLSGILFQLLDKKIKHWTLITEIIWNTCKHCTKWLFLKKLWMSPSVFRWFFYSLVVKRTNVPTYILSKFCFKSFFVRSSCTVKNVFFANFLFYF